MRPTTQLEEELKRLGFERLVIYRPGLLLNGDRCPFPPCTVLQMWDLSLPSTVFCMWRPSLRSFPSPPLTAFYT